MLDKFEAKGNMLSYSLDRKCILRFSGKDRFSGRIIHYVKIPNIKGTEELDVRILENQEDCFIYLEGNLRKWKYGRKSAVRDLNYCEFCWCIKLIAKRLGVEEEWIWKLEFTYLEMGGNIKLPRSYERFIPSLISFPELTLDRWKESTVYFNGAKYNLIFYDKLKELRDRNIISGKVAKKLIEKLFVLRFEIKVNAKSGYRKKEFVQTFGTIRENWIPLVEDWFATFQKAKSIDLFSDSIEVKKGTLPKRQSFDYGLFLFLNQIGVDRGLFFFKYFMTGKKSEAVDFVQHLFQKYKTGDRWNFYDNILSEVRSKSEEMKEGANRYDYNKKKIVAENV